MFFGAKRALPCSSLILLLCYLCSSYVLLNCVDLFDASGLQMMMAAPSHLQGPGNRKKKRHRSSIFGLRETLTMCFADAGHDDISMIIEDHQHDQIHVAQSGLNTTCPETVVLLGFG